jgi:hypothetical protein
MLTFTPSQMVEIQLQTNERVYRRLAVSLLGMYPDSAQQPADVVQEIRPIARDAVGRGMRDGALLAQHIYACKVFGTGYWERVPNLDAVLWNADLDEDLRLAWLVEWMDGMQVEMKRRGGAA